jgi:hypothetical protein
MISKSKIILPLAITICVILASCTNPFAPKLVDSAVTSPYLGDQKTIDGIFQNFRYSYIFKDTLVYGSLLANDFLFIYRDYDKGVDASWGREEDMITTSRLFDASQNLDLIWNDVVISIGDSVVQDISRGFSLTITFNPSDILNVYGRANFHLTRSSPQEVWKISQWRDESNY